MRPASQLGQRLGVSINPKMEQFATILQQSNLELEQMISQRLANNPLLEMAEDDAWQSVVENEQTEEGAETDLGIDEWMQKSADDGESFVWETQAEQGEDHQWSQAMDSQEQRDFGITAISDEVPDFNDMDGDHYCPASPGENDTNDIFSNQMSATSVLSTLMASAKSQARSPQEQWLIEILIGHLDERGLLEETLEAIALDVKKEVSALADKAGKPLPDTNWLEALTEALKILQAQDPAGVGAQNLQECCCLQVSRWKDSEEKTIALILLQEHFIALQQKDWRAISQAMGLSIKWVTAIAHRLSSLDFQPLVGLDNAETQYLIPDVQVVKVRHHWVVSINEKAYPRLKINSFIAKQIHRKRKMEELQSHLREAEQFIRDLSSRAQVVINVARYLVEYQRPYFELGAMGMRALSQKEVAVALGLAESTLSRAIQGKYMDTPMGVLPFSYFISKSKNATDMGGSVSTTAIGSFIRNMVEKENHIDPLRDEVISARLAEDGIKLSRRSVAAYRETLGIPPYHLRKF